jgi:DNA replication protein DnaC
MPSAASPTTNPAADLARAFRDLGLRGAADLLDDFVARVTRQRLGPVQMLEELVRIEQLDRARRSLERRQKRAGVGAFKPIADFDWNWPKVIDRDLADRCLALRFLDEGANVILVGAHGLGKTMLLKNIAHQAILGGHAVLVLTAAKLLNDLGSQDSTRALERRLRHYAGIALLCIDELGYLSYDSRAADLLFEVVSRRHEARRPIVMTTNLAFVDWPTVFPNATCTVALVDRLTHRADVLNIEGDSWRHKEARERAARRGKAQDRE